MKYKSTILVMFLTLIINGLIIHHSYAQPTGPSGPAQNKPAGPGGKPALPPGMSEEELKMFTEFIDSLDQETIDALTAIGEEIIKEADELGIDPFEYIELQAKMQQDFEEQQKKKPSGPQPEKAKVEKPVSTTVAPLAEAQTAQDVFAGIAKIIPIIMQKTVSDINLSNDILPFKYRLDDLVFYFTKLSDQKMLKYLNDPSFAPLIDNAKKLYKELMQLNEQFAPAEFSLEGEDAYEILNVSRSATPNEIVQAYDKITKITDPDTLELQLIKDGKSDQDIKTEVEKAKKIFDSINRAYDTLRAKEESKYLLDRMLDAISNAIDTNKVIEQARTVLQKYEPEALKLKQEQEKVEAEARKKQEAFIKKRAITTRAFAMPPASKKFKKGFKEEGFGGGAGGGYDYGFGGGGGAPTTERMKPSYGGGFKPTTKPSGGKYGEEDKKKKKEEKEEKKEKKIKGEKEGAAKGKGKAEKESKDVLVATGSLKEKLSDLKEFIKNNGLVKGAAIVQPGHVINEGEGLMHFLTTPYPAGADAAATAKIKSDQDALLIAFIVDLTKKYNDIAKFVKKTLDETLTKRDDQKKFKEEAQKAYKKFEDSDEFKSINILVKKASDRPGDFLTQTNPANIDPAKRTLVLNTTGQPCTEGEENPEPLIKCLRTAYKKFRDLIGYKEEGAPGSVPVRPAGPAPINIVPQQPIGNQQQAANNRPVLPSTIPIIPN